MNILYLHGLESKLSDPKRAILEKHANVIAPDLDYKSNPNMIEFLYETYRNQDIDIIIGSSMGGFAGYHLANLLGVLSLLYNPALPYRKGTELIIPSHLSMNHPDTMRIVLGAQDTIIDAKDNLAFLSQNVSDKTDYTIVFKRDLAHQIPIAVFEEQTKAFFESIK
nr:YqiA/YcfP family alpha/beta fold hydrolase [uncultured Flavobacterium sp.]